MSMIGRIGRVGSLVVWHCLLVAAGGHASGNDLVELSDQHRPGDVQRVKVVMEARGDLKAGDGKTTYPMSATAQAIYQERWYSVDSVCRIARHYEKSVARLKVGDTADEIQLPNNKRVIVVETESGSAPQFHALEAPLSRRELDTVRIPGNSVLLGGLLPKQPVRAGDSWVPDPKSLAAIMQLEDVTAPEVECKLVQVDRGLAKVQFKGQLIGRVDGATTSMDLSGELRCDVGTKRIRWLQLQIREERDAGPIAPAFNAVAEVRMLIETVSPPEQFAFPPTLDAPRPEDSRLEFVSSESGLRFLHEPNWAIVDDRARTTVLRWLDNGRVLIQCNMSRLPALPAGKQLSLEELQADIQKSFGDKFGEFEFARQETRKDGTHVLRIVANGEVEEGRVLWIFCHLTSSSGDRVSLTLTMDSASAKQHHMADKLLVESLQFLAPIVNKAPATEQARSSLPDATNRK